jgi:hypothetical protein
MLLCYFRDVSKVVVTTMNKSITNIGPATFQDTVVINSRKYQSSNIEQV